MLARTAMIALAVALFPTVAGAQAVTGSGGGGVRTTSDHLGPYAGEAKLVFENGVTAIAVDVSGRVTASGGFQGTISNLSAEELSRIQGAIPNVRLVIGKRTLWLVKATR